MPLLASSFTRDWLEKRRDELNGRFRVARRRYPALDPAAVIDLCAELLPPLGGAGEDGAADLLSSAYDLLLMHAGRGTLARQGGTNPGVAALFRETLPRIRPLLLSRPRFFAASLSNAVENLGRRGVEFARELPGIAAGLKRPAELLDAGAVLAWRLGDARLRDAALRVADRLPAAAALAALGAGSWPSEAAHPVVAALRADAWRRPEEALRPETLEGLPKAAPARLEKLRAALAQPPRTMLAAWKPAGPVGDFAGFDGPFDDPPLLLAAPDSSRHTLWALSGSGAFRLDADAFGWTWRADAAAADLKVGELKPRGFLASLLGQGDDGSPRLSPDGTLTSGGESAAFPGMAGASSCVTRPDFVAWTTPDSHRIRLRVARAEPA